MTKLEELLNKSGNKRGIIHGLRGDRIYGIYHDIKKRCSSINRKDSHCYNLKGIKMCEEWNKSFVSFYEWSINNGYKDSLSIDRINSNGDYSPSNCRWSNKAIQAQNVSKRKDNTSGYKGVSFEKQSNKWVANISVNGIQKKIGRYSTPIEAANAYDNFILSRNLNHTTNKMLTGV